MVQSVKKKTSKKKRPSRAKAKVPVRTTEAKTQQPAADEAAPAVPAPPQVADLAAEPALTPSDAVVQPEPPPKVPLPDHLMRIASFRHKVISLIVEKLID